MGCGASVEKFSFDEKEKGDDALSLFHIPRIKTEEHEPGLFANFSMIDTSSQPLAPSII